MVTRAPTRIEMEPELKPLGLVWIKCSRPTTLSSELEYVLQSEGYVHQGQEPPLDGPPSYIVLCPDGENVASEVKHLRTLLPDTPTLVFESHADSELARSALKAEACGFIHAEMCPRQIVRAVLLASEGIAVMPTQVLEDVVKEKSPGELSALTHRQLEVLKLVTEGLSNARIARRLSLSESTIKEHLRAAYKTLRVENRTQAARLFRRNYQPETASEPADGT